jgi:O-antigen ligase
LYYSYYRFYIGVEWYSDTENELNVTNYLSYASHGHYLFVVLLAVIFSARTPGLRITSAVLAMPVAFVLIYIGGRGPLVLSILAIPVGILLLLPFRGGLQRAWTITLSLVLGAVVVSTVIVSAGDLLPVGNLENMHTVRRFQSIISAQADDSLGARVDAQLFALRMWYERPLTGNGFGEFAVRHELTFPHNLPLELMAELGLIGLTLFLCLVTSILVQAVRSARAGPPNWINLSIMLLFVVDLLNHMTVQGYLGDDRVFFSFLGAAAGLAPDAMKAEER